jgi:sterol 3beta-glucosyltransferase
MSQEKLPPRVEAKEGGMKDPKEESLVPNLSQALKSRVRSPLEVSRYKSLEEQTQGASEADDEEEQTTGEIISSLCSKFFHAIPPFPYLSTSPISSRGENLESYFVFQPEVSPGTTPAQDDEIDIARPVSESRPSNYFLNAMTTASGYTGVDSFVNLKNHLHKATERLERTTSKSSTPDPNITYDVDMSDSDTESEGDTDSFSEPRDILRFPKPGKDPKLDIVEEEKVTTEFNDHIPRQELSRIPSTGSDSTKSFHTTYSHKPIDSNTDGANESIDKLSINDDLQEFYHGSRSNSTTYAESTTNKKRTVFEQSIVDNLDPFIIKETVLVKVKEGENLANSAFEANKELISLNIAEKLKRVFELSDDDYFYANYNAWLVKDVLLQGHLYLTRDCILFFAFLPKRNSNIDQVDGDGYTDSDDYVSIQQGSLGMKNAKYGDAVFSSVITHRYWAILRSQTLTIYSSSTDLYFPNVIIDLKTCIRTEIIEKEKEDVNNTKNQPPLPRGSTDTPFSPKASRSNSNVSSDIDSETSSLAQEISSIDESPDGFGVGVGGGAWFKLISKNKTYKFHTDNLYSARQWCNNLTKLIFQLQNSNAADEVLIKIPIENVIDFSKGGFFNKLNGEEENSDSETEEDMLLLSFRLTFLDNDEEQQSLLSAKGMKNKLKPATKTEVNGVKTSYGVDDIFFLFFGSGKSFYNLFSQVVCDHRRARDSMSVVPKPDKFMDRAKRIVRRGSKSSLDFNEKVPIKGISTLNPMKPSSTILARVQSYNNRSLRSQQTLESSSTTSGISKSEQSSISSNKSTIKKIGRRLSNPTKMFTSKKSKEIAPTLTHLPSYEKGAETEHISKIHLPRPFSLSALKNLEMSFETSHTDVRTAETRYEARHEGFDPESKSQPQAELLASTNNLQDTPLPGPLYLSDPSEYVGENKKQNKLKVITNSIKSFSNVSSMWSSNPNHFIADEADDPFFVNDVTTRDVTQVHFRDHFSLDNKNNLVATYYAHLQKSIPIYGKVYLGNNVLCFRSLLPGVSTKMILPLKDVENCFKEKGLKLAYSGLIIVIHGYEEIFFEFSNQQARDDCETLILKQLEAIHQDDSWMPKPHEWGRNYDMELSRTRLVNSSSTNYSQRLDIRLASKKIESARIKLFEDRINDAIGLDIPIILEDSPFHKIEIKPSTSFNIVLLTIGSRGDVQTYIALGKGLIAEGHNVTIATHGEYGDWIEKHGVKFKEIAGNPAELMSLMVTHGSMSVSFLKEAGSKFRGWIHDLLRTSWDACQGADILIESPSAMGGVHIAEALGIPYMRAFTMPWTRTRAYPHAFIVPDQKKGGSYNYLTHIMFESVFWKGISGQVNKWRVEDLGLPKTNLNKLQQTKIPFFYNVSPSIFPPSVDFPDWVKVTGYWFLDEGAAEDFEPPAKLVEFLEQASKDQKKIVYIGFGSIVVSDAKSLTKAIVEAVLDADVRCILNKGWSDRLTKKDKNEPEIELPPEVYNSGTIPHDWLFPKLDAAVHHGGSGTTGATLRSGLPTIIKPFFGDQFFYGSRVEDVGVGICLKKLNAKSLSKSIQTVTSDLKMIEKAKKMSDRIKRENGVLTAIEAIYSELEYARNLIVSKQRYNESHGQQIFDNRASGAQTPVVYEEDEDDDDDDDDIEDDDFSDTDEETDLDDAASKASNHGYGYGKELTESQPV